jgi:hypothetical protein
MWKVTRARINEGFFVKGKYFFVLITILFLASCSSKKISAEETKNLPDENGFVEVIKYFDTSRKGISRDMYARPTDLGWENYFVIERENFVEINGYNFFPYEEDIPDKNKDENAYYKWLYTWKIDLVNIPDTINGKPVTIIGDEAFVSRRMKKLILPAHLKTIERWAFNGSQVEEIVFNEKLKTIGEKAFGMCYAKEVKIPDSVTEIAKGAFENNRIEHLILSKNMKTICDSSFSNGSIQSVVLPPKLEDIGDYAFWANSIEKITIPASVKNIGYEAFSSVEITLGEDVFIKINERYSSLNEFAQFYNANNKQSGTYKMKARYAPGGMENYWIFGNDTE